MAAATVLGIAHVYKNNEVAIAGGASMTASLVTYNAFKNP